MSVAVSPIWPIAGAPTTGNIPTASLISQVNYYVSRLISQYFGKPRAMMLMAIMVKQALGDDMATALLNAFTIDTAVGPQLDIIGKYVGLSRMIGPGTAQPFYNLYRYSGTEPASPMGFRSYSGLVNTTGVWDRYTYSGSAATALSDVAFRFMLKLKIVENAMDGTLSSIVSLLHSFFPSGDVIVTDNQDMTLTYDIADTVPVDATTLAAYLPKPMGVGLTVNIVGASLIRVLMDGSTIRVLQDGSTERIANLI